MGVFLLKLGGPTYVLFSSIVLEGKLDQFVVRVHRGI
jgi:hypothetical protein